jgi:hypothetical protein
LNPWRVVGLSARRTRRDSLPDGGPASPTSDGGGDRRGHGVRRLAVWAARPRGGCDGACAEKRLPLVGLALLLCPNPDPAARRTITSPPASSREYALAPRRAAARGAGHAGGRCQKPGTECVREAGLRGPARRRYGRRRAVCVPRIPTRARPAMNTRPEVGSSFAARGPTAIRGAPEPFTGEAGGSRSGHDPKLDEQTAAADQLGDPSRSAKAHPARRDPCARRVSLSWRGQTSRP